MSALLCNGHQPGTPLLISSIGLTTNVVPLETSRRIYLGGFAPGAAIGGPESCFATGELEVAGGVAALVGPSGFAPSADIGGCGPGIGLATLELVGRFGVVETPAGPDGVGSVWTVVRGNGAISGFPVSKPKEPVSTVPGD